jgi:hypothetical protein
VNRDDSEIRIVLGHLKVADFMSGEPYTGVLTYRGLFACLRARSHVWTPWRFTRASTLRNYRKPIERQCERCHVVSRRVLPPFFGDPDAPG